MLPPDTGGGATLCHHHAIMYRDLFTWPVDHTIEIGLKVYNVFFQRSDGADNSKLL